MDLLIVTLPEPANVARYPLHRATIDGGVIVITEVVSSGEEGARGGTRQSGAHDGAGAC